jgi:uncharacterized membrane protein YphA (DoxX/SURF4 family)
MARKITIEIITILFIILWIYAGLTKLLDYEKFRFQLGRSPFIQPIAPIIAWAMPLFEIAIAVLLVAKRTREIGMYASFFLMVLFTGYIYIMLHYSYFIPCSCGGILANMPWKTHLVFNVIFSLIGFAGILSLHKRINEDNFQVANL